MQLLKVYLCVYLGYSSDTVDMEEHDKRSHKLKAALDNTVYKRVNVKLLVLYGVLTYVQPISCEWVEIPQVQNSPSDTNVTPAPSAAKSTQILSPLMAKSISKHTEESTANPVKTNDRTTIKIWTAASLIQPGNATKEEPKLKTVKSWEAAENRSHFITKIAEHRWTPFSKTEIKTPAPKTSQIWTSASLRNDFSVIKSIPAIVSTTLEPPATSTTSFAPHEILISTSLTTIKPQSTTTKPTLVLASFTTVKNSESPTTLQQSPTATTESYQALTSFATVKPFATTTNSPKSLKSVATIKSSTPRSSQNSVSSFSQLETPATTVKPPQLTTVPNWNFKTTTVKVSQIWPPLMKNRDETATKSSRIWNPLSSSKTSGNKVADKNKVSNVSSSRNLTSDSKLINISNATNNVTPVTTTATPYVWTVSSKRILSTTTKIPDILRPTTTTEATQILQPRTANFAVLNKNARIENNLVHPFNLSNGNVNDVADKIHFNKKATVIKIDLDRNESEIPSIPNDYELVKNHSVKQKEDKVAVKLTNYQYKNGTFNKEHFYSLPKKVQNENRRKGDTGFNAKDAEEIDIDFLDNFTSSNDTSEEEVESKEEENGYSYAGFIPFLGSIQSTLMRNTHKTVDSKIHVLQVLRDKMLVNIADRMDHLWHLNKSGNSRIKREDFYDMGFPSNEGALMTIGFLTFGVFLIKLVLKIILVLKYKSGFNGYTGTTYIARKRREKRMFHDEDSSLRILSLIEQFKFN